MHAEDSGARFIKSEVTSVDFTVTPFVLVLTDRTEMKSKAVIIATGATPKKLDCPGEEDFFGNGISTCVLCDGALYKNKRVVIVGGGNTAVEDAIFLRKFTDKITIVHKHDLLNSSKATQEKILNDPNINIIYDSTVTRFIGDAEMSTLSKVEITNIKTKRKQYLDIDGVFLAIGLSPNTGIFCQQLDCEKSGHIKAHDQVKTSIPGVFVAGDAQDLRYRQAIVSAGLGSMAAIEAEKYIETIS